MSVAPFKVPASIGKLGAEVESRILELVHESERRQAQEGMAAAETSLGLVPRPLRPLVRKVLGI
jgi:hypothetical protein